MSSNKPSDIASSNGYCSLVCGSVINPDTGSNRSFSRASFKVMGSGFGKRPLSLAWSSVNGLPVLGSFTLPLPSIIPSSRASARGTTCPLVSTSAAASGSRIFAMIASAIGYCFPVLGSLTFPVLGFNRF